ncbi:MAG: iron ABC transporter permease [Oscillospiraceae bacterium]|nr:iron ABC transporter permease [Oscillospiraceae bacterium]
MTRGGRRVAILAVILVALFFWSWIFGNASIGVGVSVTGDGLNVYGWNAASTLGLWRSAVESILSMDGFAQRTLMGYTCIFLVGMAMSCSGAVYQGVFQNPMASPTTLGVTAGGILGGIVYILFFWDSSFMGRVAEEYGASNGGGLVWAATSDELMEIYDEMSVFDLYGMTICTVLGCFAGVMLIVGISMISGKGKINTLSLMLSGSIFATVVNTVTQTVQYAILYNVGVDSTDVRLTAIASLQGSSSSIGNSMQLAPFLFVAIPVGLCLVICFAMTGKLNILVFGEDEARAMGVPVQRFRVILIICCTVMTATVMAFCGQISMLGFLMPHLARFLVGPDFKHLVPASALLGGIGCLIVANVCSATLSYGKFNTYIGVFCTVASILFILLYRRNRHADWS